MGDSRLEIYQQVKFNRKNWKSPSVIKGKSLRINL